MKKEFLNILSRIGKVYFRGTAVVFTSINLVEIYNYGYKKINDNIEGKIVISAGWPVTLPIISVMGASDKPYSYGTLFLWSILFVLP